MASSAPSPSWITSCLRGQDLTLTLLDPAVSGRTTSGAALASAQAWNTNFRTSPATTLFGQVNQPPRPGGLVTTKDQILSKPVWLVVFTGLKMVDPGGFYPATVSPQPSRMFMGEIVVVDDLSEQAELGVLCE